MTDRHPDDEALSAVLDGEGDEADRAHAEGCTPCQARMGELRAVSRAVGTAVAPPPAAAISAAVKAAMAEASVRPSGRQLQAPRRAPRRRPFRWSAPPPARLAAIAAIIVAVAGIASLIAVTTSHNGTPKASSAASALAHPAATSPTTAAGAATAGAAASAGPATATAPAAGAVPPDLGTQSDPAVLAAALHSLERQGLPGVATTILAPPACASPAASGAGLDPGSRALFDAPLRWKGQDAEVLIFALPTAGGGQTAVVVAAGTCAVLTSFPL